MTHTGGTCQRWCLTAESAASLMRSEESEQRACCSEPSRVVFEIVWKEKSENFTRQCFFLFVGLFFNQQLKSTKTNFEVTWGTGLCISVSAENNDNTSFKGCERKKMFYQAVAERNSRRSREKQPINGKNFWLLSNCKQPQNELQH